MSKCMHKENIWISVITIIFNRIMLNTRHLIWIQQIQCNWMQLDYYLLRECTDFKTIYVFIVKNQNISRMSAWKQSKLLSSKKETMNHQHIKKYWIIKRHIKKHFVKNYNTIMQSTENKLQSHQNLQCYNQSFSYQHSWNWQSEI